MAKNYKNYTNKEMQAITIAKEIKDGQIVIVGTGLPLIGATVAPIKGNPVPTITICPSFISLAMVIACISLFV